MFSLSIKIGNIKAKCSFIKIPGVDTPGNHKTKTNCYEKFFNSSYS